MSRVVVTDKFRSYGAAHREGIASVEHRRSKYLNQRFPSAFSGISPHFRPRQRLMTAPDHRTEMGIRLAIGEQVTGVADRPHRGLSTGQHPSPPRAPTRRQTPTPQ